MRGGRNRSKTRGRTWKRNANIKAKIEERSHICGNSIVISWTEKTRLQKNFDIYRLKGTFRPTMFLLLFVISLASDLCHSQMMYNGVVPNDPRYYLQRAPVRRSAMEALERLRMPVARYYPQVDASIPSGAYQAPVASLSGYPLSSEDGYALPPQWSDDFAPQPQERVEDEGDYGNYEYENVFAPAYRPAPVYADDAYVQAEPVADPEAADNNQLYNDLMVNYFLGGSEPAVEQPEPFDLQRRSGLLVNPQGVVRLSNVVEANKNSNNTSNNAEVPPTSAPMTPTSSQVPPQVQMTAVPSSPEKKEIKSLVIPEPVAQPTEDHPNLWREAGQKEEPLFRPFQSSQRTTWDILSRAKNSVQKRPIPMLKKMITGGQEMKKDYDPLREELQSLRKERSK